jgi:site-specific DNA recombinase
MKVVFYARVSTDRQAQEGVSMSGQLEQMKRWAEQNSHATVRVYEEPGLTATDDKRPIFQEMISDATSPEHPFDAIVVFAQSRFFRNLFEFLNYERRLRRHNVQVISITQPTGQDEAGGLLRTMIAGFDDYASKENGKNVRRSMLENTRLGFFNGSRAPFGYTASETDLKGRNGKKRKLAPNPDEAEIVRLIFRLAQQGLEGQPMGVKKIAEHLNAKGYRRRGREWKAQTVWSVISSRIYIGEYTFNKHDSRENRRRPESEWVTCQIPPIIDQQTFEAVEAVRQERAPHNYESKGVYSPTLLGGIAKCARCGSGLVLMSGKSGKYDYYRCSRRQFKSKDLCDQPNIPKEDLDAAVLKAIADEVLTVDRVAALLEELRANIASIQNPDREREKALQRQIALTTEQINLWYSEVEAGRIELHQSLRDRLAAAQQRLDHMAQELQTLARRRGLPLRKFGETQIRNFSEGIRTELQNQQSKFAKSYLKAIVSEIRSGRSKGPLPGV